jgi:hypothetical protein
VQQSNSSYLHHAVIVYASVIAVLICGFSCAQAASESPVEAYAFEEGPSGSAIVSSLTSRAKLEVFGDGPKARVEAKGPIGDRPCLSLESTAERSGAYLDSGLNKDFLSVRGAFSIALWFKLRKPDRNDCLVSVADVEHSVFQLTSWNGILRAALHSAEDEEAFVSLDSVKITPGEWHHVVVVHDADQRSLSVYLDGNLMKTTTYTFQPRDNPGNWIIGVDRGGNNAANLLMARFQFFRKALGADDVASVREEK